MRTSILLKSFNKEKSLNKEKYDGKILEQNVTKRMTHLGHMRNVQWIGS